MAGRSHRTSRTAAALVAATLLATACGGGGDHEVLVFVAASLTEAFTELEAAHEAANPDVEITLNLAGSSSLREQILEGAPADVFASADEVTMAPVVDAGLVTAGPDVFATNTLQIAVPAGNPAGVAGPADLADDDLLVGLCAAAVPCGRLADAMFANAGVEPAADTREPDVRALVGKVRDGELDAGVAYRTDIDAVDGVDGVVIDSAVNVESRYPIAALSTDEDTLAFMAFVGSDAGQRILAEHGFGPP